MPEIFGIELNRYFSSLNLDTETSFDLTLHGQIFGDGILNIFQGFFPRVTL